MAWCMPPPSRAWVSRARRSEARRGQLWAARRQTAALLTGSALVADRRRRRQERARLPWRALTEVGAAGPAALYIDRS